MDFRKPSPCCSGVIWLDETFLAEVSLHVRHKFMIHKMFYLSPSTLSEDNCFPKLLILAIVTPGFWRKIIVTDIFWLIFPLKISYIWLWSEISIPGSWDRFARDVFDIKYVIWVFHEHDYELMKKTWRSKSSGLVFCWNSKIQRISWKHCIGKMTVQLKLPTI